MALPFTSVCSVCSVVEKAGTTEHTEHTEKKPCSFVSVVRRGFPDKFLRLD